MDDLERAREILRGDGCTCVLVRGAAVHVSRLSGVAPLLAWGESGTDLRGFSAADRVVGGAAAMLLALAGVEAAYAPVMSERAVEVLSKHRIQSLCDARVRAIINRAGDGPCPMERAVEGIEDPRAARDAIRRALDLLQSRKGGATA